MVISTEHEFHTTCTKVHHPTSKGMGERDTALYYLDCYLERLINRGRKESTIMSYHQVIGSLINFLADRHLHCAPKLVTEKEIMVIVNEYPIADLSKKSYLQVFSRWLIMMADNTVVRDMDLLWPSSERPRRRWANYEDAQKMYEAEQNPTNRIILALAMDEGMRAVEISRMRVDDIKGNWLRVRGKGHREGKIRSVPMSERVKREIREYAVYRDAILWNSDEDCGIFILRDDGLPLTPHAVSQRVIRMGMKSGNDITAHALRRRFITDTLNSGVKIEVCSKLVGHENPMITAMYYNCDRELFADAMVKRRKYLSDKIKAEN